MGDYADMMLDGTCCCSCGEFIDTGSGFPEYCASCKPAQLPIIRTKKLKSPKQKKTVHCVHLKCGRWFVNADAMRQHLRQFHKIKG